MSYFIAGYGNALRVAENLDISLVEAVPEEIRKDILCINTNSSFLVSYGTRKVIKDILIHDDTGSSWLAILGTPLLHLQSEHEKATLINRFFNDPKRTVKDELDGCFAALAYNNSSSTFYAVTDYDNTTPIFYALTENGAYFSSHELPLARCMHSEIDPLGFAMTIQLRLTWGSYSRFKNIRKLLPCQIMTFHGADKPFPEFFWKPSDEFQWPSDFDKALAMWSSLLRDSVWEYYSSSRNKSVICDFTAGEDARLILSQCHALGIPFSAMVDGPRYLITGVQLRNNATYIALMNDGYEDYFGSCTAFATNAANPLKNWKIVKFCGAPGGEVFRGSYYLRGKALFPKRRGKLDYLFFTKMKFMLDFHPGLLCFPDEECKQMIFQLVEEALEDVSYFPIGIKIDHLLRTFQTCNDGLIFKNPRYLPFATKRLTQSIYNIPPHFKRGGRLTKACTEILFPKLALVKTQKGVPTIRRTLGRTYLFFPEYLTDARSIMQGTLSRLLKWTDSNKPCYEWNKNAPAIKTLLNEPPYASWFSSSESMVTGHLYNSDIVNSLLMDARSGSSKYVPILGRIIGQELACRWVYSEK
jgi:hypothetical protein